MERIIDIATALLLAAVIWAAVSGLRARSTRNEPHSDIISFEIKPVTPEGQRI